MMRITEAARATGTTPRALRWYEEQGLLNPARTPTGYREYGERELDRISTIRMLLADGFTVADLRTFAALLNGPVPDRLAGRPETARCATAIATARARLAALDRHLAQTRALRDRLAAFLDVT